MTRKNHKISKEVKEQILNRIKNEGVSVSQAAEEHGIKGRTIYGWLAKGVEGQPTLMEVAKLKRDKKALLELIGKLTLDLSQKKS